MEPSAGLASLFDLHRGELLRFLRARCGNADDADDCLQELWLKSANVPDGPIANGRAYLFRMANNLLLDRRRGQHRAMQRDRRWLEDGGEDVTAELRVDPDLPADEILAQQQEADVLAKAIAALPPGAQRALRLHRFDGYGQAEVATIMGISRSGVEKHLALAMRHLRGTLADCGFFGVAALQTQGRTNADRPRPDEKI